MPSRGSLDVGARVEVTNRDRQQPKGWSGGLRRRDSRSGVAPECGALADPVRTGEAGSAGEG